MLHSVIDYDKLPPNVKERMSDASVGPEIAEHEVYLKISKATKPNSSVNGDIPKKLVKEFGVEFSKPMQIIFNSITRTGEYPRQWVREEQVVIPKSKPVDSLDSLRSLSKTVFFS